MYIDIPFGVVAWMYLTETFDLEKLFILPIAKNYVSTCFIPLYLFFANNVKNLVNNNIESKYNLNTVLLLFGLTLMVCYIKLYSIFVGAIIAFYNKQYGIGLICITLLGLISNYNWSHISALFMAMIGIFRLF